MVILMPIRVLFAFSIIFNVIFIIIIYSFIENDNYFQSAEHHMRIEELSKKILNKSCLNSADCELKIYAKHGSLVKKTFEKSIVKEKQSKKKFIFEDVANSIKDLIAEADLKSIISKSNPAECERIESKNLTICQSEEIVGVFKAENCENCIKTFEKEFKVLEKKYFRSLTIKFAHRIYNFFKKFFNENKKNNLENNIKEKIESFILD